MSTKAHYDDHLAHFYSWMAGNFEDRAAGQQDCFSRNGILPQSSKIAFDLGAGHGLQAVPLARLGFTVKAFDFSTVLLAELNDRKGALPIEAIEADFRAIERYAYLQPELIICMGDTISHLDSEEELEEITNLCFGILSPGGKLVFSFRDYGFALEGDHRFIPVKSDNTRIHTCFLEYFETRVRVTDLLHEKENGNWKQKVSSYWKLRLTRQGVKELVEKSGFTVLIEEVQKRMHYLVATK